MKLIRHTVLSLLVAVCSYGQSSLTPEEEAIIAALEFERAIMVSVKALGTSLERLKGLTVDYEAFPAAGVVVVTKPDQGHAVLAAVRRTLSGSPYSAYLNDRAYGRGPDKVAIMKTRDPYDYLAVVRTNGLNYDIDHAQVLARYRKWAGRFGLTLTGAGHDWMEAEFSIPPPDWLAFAKEVYGFCPDVVDQGTGSVEALAREMRRANVVFLWWD